MHIYIHGIIEKKVNKSFRGAEVSRKNCTEYMSLKGRLSFFQLFKAGKDSLGKRNIMFKDM